MRQFRKRMLVNGLAMALILSSLPTQYISATEKNDIKFSDIKGHWSENFISDFVNKGYINGYEDGTFRPDNNVTRAEFITIVNKAFGFTQKESENFSDVKSGDWYYEEVLKAAKQGYISGYEDKTFRPNAKITREEACKIIGTILKANGDGKTKFKDDSEIAKWAINYVDGLVDMGIINGYEDNTFKSKNNTTRGESVKTLYGAIDKYKPDGGEPPVINPTPPVNPEPPSTSIKVNSKRMNKVVALDWNMIDGSTYTIKKGESKEKLKTMEENITDNGYLDETEDTNKKYYYMIEAKKEDGKIEQSAVIEVKEFIDTDKDFLEDSEELKLGTDVKNPDTDDDGLLDGEEVSQYGTDPKNSDTDADGLDDAFEVMMLNTSPNKKDTDNNGVTDDKEDSDNDSLDNKKEKELDTDPLSDDTDYDNLKDNKELELKTDPKNQDTDGDTLLDGDEVSVGLSPLKKDTDGDSILDPDESVKYETENSDIDEDEDVQVKIDVDTEAKNIEDIYINNKEDANFITNKETPGYLGAPYYLNIPKGSEATVKFSYVGDKAYSGQLGIYFYNKDLQCLEEVTNVISAKTKNVVSTEVKNTISARVSKPGEYILLDKEEQKKAWEKEIVPPGEMGKKLDVVLAIDSSGSMGPHYDNGEQPGNDPQGLRKVESKIFVDRLIKEELGRAAIVNFDSWAYVVQHLTDDIKLLNNAIDTIDEYGGTDISYAIKTSVNEIKENSNEKNEKYTLLLTDGKQMGSSFDNNCINHAKENDVKVYTVGLGKNTDDVLLEKIASETGGRYLHTDLAEGLDNVFEEFTGETIDKSTDTDGDGISDYHEDYFRMGNGRIVKLDKNSTDTDGDGIPDGEEAGVGADQPYGFNKERGYWIVKSDPSKVDTDSDNINDKEDITDEDGNTNNGNNEGNNPAVIPNIIEKGKFTKHDKLFMDASDATYLQTSGYRGKTLRYVKQESLTNGKDVRQGFESILNWKILYSDDSNFCDPIDGKDTGFGALAIKDNNNNVIIAFEGSGDYMNPESLVNDWIETDGGVVAFGNDSQQVYSAYKFVERVLKNKDTKDCNIYITGHSLGGWLAQKIGGAILQGGLNLQDTNSDYYKINQIPKAYKEEVTEKYTQTFKGRRSDIKKIVTYAAPGFYDNTKIYENPDQSLKINFNYKMRNDFVSTIGKDKFAFGKTRWCGKAELFALEHPLAFYYRNYEYLFKDGHFTDME